MTAIKKLSDRNEFVKKRELVWQNNIDYWLKGPLRHVVDVGDYIADRTAAFCRRSDRKRPVVVDMGFGDGWLLRALLQREVSFTYIGLDRVKAFIAHAEQEFSQVPNVSFELFDVEEPHSISISADVVVNAFNFFELSELSRPFSNAAQFLRPGGTLQVATIDKTYLILALCNSLDEFKQHLQIYESTRGTKYFFQPIDLGSGASELLCYPSVLYSTEDYLSAANENGLMLKSYKEHPFTGAVIPKIYCHYEFEKNG
jgi:2-polyprenyl-3-methyl-5-hydroxy-6-metoxy-1,4-benzoquinol methylase